MSTSSSLLQNIAFWLIVLHVSFYKTTATQTTPINNNHKTVDFVKDVGPTGILLDNHMDLPKICMLLNISMENCNCENPIGLCKINTTIEIVEVIIECTIDDAMKARIGFTLVASCIGIIGNLIVLIIRSHSFHKSIHHQLIMGLALADLLFSIAQLIYNVPYLIFGCRWIYGTAMCHVLPSFLGISSSIDVGFITIIAVERYIAIVHPLKKNMPRRRRRIYALVAINLLVGACSVIPMFLVFEVSLRGACVENWINYPNGSLIYSWLLLIFLVVIPVTITSVLHCHSIKVIRSMLSDGKLLFPLNNNNDNENNDKSEKHLKRNRNLLLVISSLLAAFTLLHSPNRIVWLVIDHVGQDNLSPGLFKGLKIFGLVPYSLHIMINPIIYSVIDKKFRSKVMRLFFWRKRRLETSNSSQTINSMFDETTNNTTYV